MTDEDLLRGSMLLETFTQMLDDELISWFARARRTDQSPFVESKLHEILDRVHEVKDLAATLRSEARAGSPPATSPDMRTPLPCLDTLAYDDLTSEQMLRCWIGPLAPLDALTAEKHYFAWQRRVGSAAPPLGFVAVAAHVFATRRFPLFQPATGPIDDHWATVARPQASPYALSAVLWWVLFGANEPHPEDLAMLTAYVMKKKKEE